MRRRVQMVGSPQSGRSRWRKFSLPQVAVIMFRFGWKPFCIVGRSLCVSWWNGVTKVKYCLLFSLDRVAYKKSRFEEIRRARRATREEERNWEWDDHNSTKCKFIVGYVYQQFHGFFNRLTFCSANAGANLFFYCSTFGVCGVRSQVYMNDMSWCERWWFF